MSLSYIIGDVTDPQLSIDQFGRPVIIPHVVNDAGVMGAGVAKALYTKWPAVKVDYITYGERWGLTLGDVINTTAQSGKIYVQSMVAQSTPGVNQVARVDVRKHGNTAEFLRQRPPIRYGALVAAMRDVGAKTAQVRGSIHAPRFGSDLAGGDWNVIESLILELWVDNGLDVTIYDFKG